MRNPSILAISVPLLALLLGGCAGTLSGMGEGGSKFGCKAPDGVTCSSLSGVYANAVANNLPALRKEGKSGGTHDDSATLPPAREIVGRAPSSGDPIRSQPRILRAWIAPWEDAEGDLHDQSYIYVVTDLGRWMLEHHKQRIMDRYRPTVLSTGQPQAQAVPGTPQKPQIVTGTGAMPGSQAREAQTGPGAE